MSKPEEVTQEECDAAADWLTAHMTCKPALVWTLGSFLKLTKMLAQYKRYEPASPPPSAPKVSSQVPAETAQPSASVPLVEGADKPFDSVIPDVLDNSRQDSISRVAPPSARPAEPKCPICGHAFHVGTCQKPEGKVCHCFTSIQYEMDVEGPVKLPAAPKSSTLGEEMSKSSAVPEVLADDERCCAIDKFSEGCTLAVGHKGDCIFRGCPPNCDHPSHAAPSAPASAAREQGCTHTLSDRETAVADGYCPQCMSEMLGELREQTRQLRSEMAREQAISAKCWATYAKALNDAGVPNQVVASTEDETFTSKGIRWLAKERDDWRQRAQAAEAERDRAKAELAAIMKTLYIDVYDEDEGEPYSYLLPAEPEPIVCESISEAVKEFYELCDKEHNKLTEELERLRKEAK